MSNEFYTQYYIESSKGRDGPYDAMSMVRKIRNGKITEETMVYVGEAYSGVPAGSLHEFELFFNPPDDAEDAPLPLLDDNLHLGEMLKDAWSYYSDNQLLSLGAGGIVIGGIILGMLLSTFLPYTLLAALMSIFGGLALFLFLIYITRHVAAQDVDQVFIMDLARNRGLDLLISAVIAAGLPIGVPAIIALYLPAFGSILALIGFVAFAFFIFTPLFILQNPTLRFNHALAMSKSWVLNQSVSNMLVIIGLVAVNALAALCFLIPVFITLPVTFVAIADLFVQRVNL